MRALYNILTSLDTTTPQVRDNLGGSSVGADENDDQHIRDLIAQSKYNEQDTTYSAKITTSDATATTLFTYKPVLPITMIEAKIIARRTGGTAGTAGDGAGYVVRGTYKNISGTTTLIGSVNADYTAESQAGWAATFTLSSNNILITVTGAVDNTILWYMRADIITI